MDWVWIGFKAHPSSCITACLNSTTNRFSSLDGGLYGINTILPIHEYPNCNVATDRVLAADILPNGTLEMLQERHVETVPQFSIHGRRKRGLDWISHPDWPDDFEGMSEVDAAVQAAIISQGGSASGLAGIRKKKRMTAGKLDDENIDPATAISKLNYVIISTLSRS
jgi:hypothetical protein